MVGVAHFTRRIEHEFATRLEHDAIVHEAADADLRALQIDQHADFAACFEREFAYQLNALRVLFSGAVREIHAHHVESRFYHARECLRVAGSRAERGDDFGAAGHGIQD